MKPAFDGRVVVVTGAAGELGFAVAERLAREGARLRLPVRNAAGAERLRALDPARVTIVPDVELADEGSVQRFYAAIPALWGSIHCAGGFTAASLAETATDALQRMLSTNALSCFICSREAVRRLVANPAAPEGKGRIVNVAAMTAVEPARGAGLAAYAASKAVVASLTRTTAAEVAAQAIWVNAVAPSILDTPANRRAMPSADFARWPKVEEVAEAIVGLASPENRTITGAIVPVTGRT